MKVTTLNLAGYKNWPERESRIIAYLNNTSPDLIFLQEVKFDTTHSLNTQSTYLNNKLHTPYVYAQTSVSRYYMQSDGIESREGLAVFSKHPILSSEVISLTKKPDDKHVRIIQKVNILVNEQIVTYTNVHFSNNNYALEQLAETLQILKNSGSKSVILGDFNIFDIKAVSDLYSPEYIVSTDFSTYISFPSENVTLDYVLLPHGYSFESLNVTENLSDHNAITFTCSFE